MDRFNARAFDKGDGAAAGGEALFVRGVETRTSLGVDTVRPNGDSWFLGVVPRFTTP
jgi:hypothetical protein